MATQFWTRAFLAAVIIAMVLLAGLAYLRPDSFAAHFFPGIARLSGESAQLLMSPPELRFSGFTEAPSAPV